jgi:membrane-bound lytic murein transglycosylase D
MARVDYKIKSGDNLGFIASWYNVRVSDLKYWNNLYSNTIRSGSNLIIYVPKSRLDHYSKINEMSFAEKQRSVGKDVPEDPSPTMQSAEGGDYIYYTVKPGDTLWDIAGEYQGVSDTDLIELNNLGDGNNIRPGMVIKIKPKG